MEREIEAFRKEVAGSLPLRGLVRPGRSQEVAPALRA
jgi:hypothetical protein